MGFINAIKNTIKQLTEALPGFNTGSARITSQSPPTQTGQSMPVLNLPHADNSLQQIIEMNQPPAHGFGTVGTQKFGGYYAEEYLTWLQGRNGVQTFDEMFRSDPQVFSSIVRTLNKLKNAKYYIKPSSKDKAAKERAAFLNYAIFKTPQKVWSENLNDIYSFLIYGPSVFEPGFRIDRSKKYGYKWVIDHFGWRNPKTIWQWFTQGEKVQSIRQISWGDDFKYANMPGQLLMTFKGSDGIERKVPWDELIVFTNLRFGNNLEGISNLRPMYGPYMRKNEYHKTNAIGIENNARGLREYGVDSDFLGTDKDKKLDEINNASAVANVPMVKIAKDKMSFNYHETKYQSDAVEKSIRIEDAYISKVTQTEGQELGMTDTGSRALGEDKSKGHDESIQNYAKYVCEKLNSLVRYLEIVNFGEQDEYCEMAVEGLESKPTLETAQAWKVLVEAGLVDVTPEIKAMAAEKFDFPLLEADLEDGGDDGAEETPAPADEVKKETKEHGETIKEIAKDAAAGKPKPVEAYAQEIVNAHKKQASECGCGKHNKQLGEYKRDLTPWEKKVNLAEIKKDFNDSKARLGALVKVSIGEMLKAYKSDLAATLAARKSPADIEIKKKGKYNSLLREEIKNIVINARTLAAGEVRGAKTQLAEKPKPTALPQSTVLWIGRRADSIVETQAADLKKVLTNKVFYNQDNGKTDEETLFSTMKEGEEYAETAARGTDSFTTVQAINEGRASMFEEYKSSIRGFQFSALLENSCDLCVELDGLTFEVDDPSSVEYTPPLHPNCECVLIPITMDEAAPDEWDGLNTIENSFTKDEIAKYKVLAEVR